MEKQRNIQMGGIKIQCGLRCGKSCCTTMIETEGKKKKTSDRSKVYAQSNFVIVFVIMNGEIQSQTQKAFCDREKSSSGIGLRCRVASSDTVAGPDSADSLALRKCAATLGTATASSLPLVRPPRRTRTSRATEPRCIRRRAEVEVGVVDGDPGAARVARVEQDQRERSLSSPSAGQSNSTSADSSPSSGKDAITGV